MSDFVHGRIESTHSFADDCFSMTSVSRVIAEASCTCGSGVDASTVFSLRLVLSTALTMMKQTKAMTMKLIKATMISRRATGTKIEH